MHTCNPRISAVAASAVRVHAHPNPSCVLSRACAQITHCSDKNPPEEVARLVQSLELTGDGNNLIDYKSKVDIFINK